MDKEEIYKNFARGALFFRGTTREGILPEYEEIEMFQAFAFFNDLRNEWEIADVKK